MEMTTTPGRGRIVAGEVQLRMINAGVKPVPPDGTYFLGYPQGSGAHTAVRV